MRLRNFGGSNFKSKLVLEDINQYKEKDKKKQNPPSSTSSPSAILFTLSLSLSEHLKAEIGNGQSGAPRENGPRTQVPHLVTLSIPKHSDDLCFLVISLMKKNCVWLMRNWRTVVKDPIKQNPVSSPLFSGCCSL